MTLIVGIKCVDGIVVAADGAATLGSLGTLTALQKTVRKLSILQHGKIIIGCSGSVGLCQRLTAVLDQSYTDGDFKNKPIVAGERIRDKFFAVVGKEWTGANAVVNILGGGIAQSSAVSQTLVALPIKDEPHLIQFDHQCAFEIATDQLPFVALGSGTPIADPFLAFLRRILWENHPPTLADGVFGAVWTLKHAIDTNPGGVSEPIQVAVIERSPGREWVAREYDSNELREHEEAVVNAERQLKAFRSRIADAAGEGDAEGTTPPPP